MIELTLTTVAVVCPVFTFDAPGSRAICGARHTLARLPGETAADATARANDSARAGSWGGAGEAKCPRCVARYVAKWGAP